ncbi:ribosome biogenesis GTPase Der [Lautropia dentalis]|uniref:GTPase Der n=1 Tax=Lautropia dentalis TaxID=2490857 RepID=A0A3R8T3M9_9BURK|nr:ribosome biogenesis GTPase Der [Lautropia dentalis]RRN45560.1 ribosome biogenesis GTPase Der [Lautropia dentalis]
MTTPVPVIALVGRPNVGKSTLFNRLTRSRDALVANIPGLTRDRHYGSATIDDQRVVLIDTGGFEPVAATGVAEQMARQTRQAVIEADVVVFVVDGRQGLLARDEEIARELRRTARKVILAVNKSEGIARAVAAAEFHALGLGDPMPISATHGDGVRALMDACLEDWLAEEAARREQAEELARLDAEARAVAAAEAVRLQVEAGQGSHTAEAFPAGAGADAHAAAGTGRDGQDAGTGGTAAAMAGDAGARAAEGTAAPAGAVTPDGAEGTGGAGTSAPPKPVRVAIVGRPNGGKSTLINALLGEERVIAFNQPGTTRDSISIDFRWRNRDYQLIDTAGLRRRGKVHDTVEKFSVVKTLQAIEDCNVAVLMIDAVDGVSEQDSAIAGYILEAGRALVIALNKWDAVPADARREVLAECRRRLYFLDWAPMLTISALKNRALDKLMKAVDDARAAATRKLSTPKLTRMLHAAVLHQQPPRTGPFRPKLRYAHQGGQNPPVIVIHGNSLDKIGDGYRRFLEGWFRERLALQGTPLRIEFRSAANPFAGRKS